MLSSVQIFFKLKYPMQYEDTTNLEVQKLYLILKYV